MSFFPQTIQAAMAKRQIGAALLTFADFREVPRRWWPGHGLLRAGGHDWLGAGEFISIEGLEQPIGTRAPKMTFTLSGVDATIVQMARQASDRVKDRRITVYIQFFDVTPDDAGKQPWSLLDSPYALATGIMDQMSYTLEGADRRTVTLTAESLWVNRRRPPYGFWTDRDQNSRFPGDRGLEQVVNLVQKQARWPVF
ncbi:hypothetical protein [Pelagibacterium sediminicola]|uniref:hypothetical protein n=1 Tax=Pelagibacterium sediminicola TaxID=2248761 RepID=UPI000E3224FE|nr:hypothetical protein [Pelagibacterium sediminicola]